MNFAGACCLMAAAAAVLCFNHVASKNLSDFVGVLKLGFRVGRGLSITLECWLWDKGVSFHMTSIRN